MIYDRIVKALISSYRVDLDTFYFHPKFSGFLVAMMVGLAVVAVTALALISTGDAGTEALAVVLPAGRFLASALPAWDEGWHSWEVPRVPEVGHSLSVIYPSKILLMVTTASADAIFPASAAPCKALAIQLQAIYFGTLASSGLMFFLGRHPFPGWRLRPHGGPPLEQSMGPCRFLVV